MGPNREPDFETGEDEKDWVKTGDQVGVLVDLRQQKDASVKFFKNGTAVGECSAKDMEGPLTVCMYMGHSRIKITLLLDASEPEI